MTSYCSSERLYSLNRSKVVSGRAVIYWMSREQRIDDNWAFIHSVELAASQGVPVEIVFTLSPLLFGSSSRVMLFMLEGLKEVEARASELRISFTVLYGDEPWKLVKAYAISRFATVVLCDFFPLRNHLSQQLRLAEHLSIPVIEVDSHNIVPCRFVSDKQEYGAYTLRGKISRLIKDFLIPIPDVGDLLSRFSLPFSGQVEANDWPSIFDEYNVDESFFPVKKIHSGYSGGITLLEDFISSKLQDYAENRNNPNRDAQSNLSFHLHFGQISPQLAALSAVRFLGELDLKGGFLDEIIVRRELADNFCLYNQNYDNFNGFPEWAKHSLKLHSTDVRSYVYDFDEFDQAKTHEALWNAAQNQLKKSGRIYGYLRMYWAKKILEWSKDPESAMRIAVGLNDKYAIDGNDPNGYAGCSWAIGGVHDRGWVERPVFGKIRYMNLNGCRRKFNVNEYVDRWGV
ncbi:MAG: deoxyribodipyrimidine photo-lyase [Spirochaetales bacterium]|nr:deoxyribodipyrimidine photo-lyase [Spirochaetales bacterium]